LVGSRRFLDEVSDRGSPLWNILQLHYLSNLDRAAIDELSEYADDIQEGILQAVWEQSGGHPFLAQYLLHHIWGAEPDSGNEATVAQLVDRFLHERQTDLEGWAEAVGIAGLQLYDQFVNEPGWLDEEDLIQAIADRNIAAKRGLVALSYHGFITHDGAWKRYRRAGSILQRWYIQESPHMYRKMLAESENQKESYRPVDRHQTFHTGDIYHLTGNFQKAIVNVSSTLQNATQTISGLDDTNPSIKAELEKLVKELNDALQQVPPDKVEDAEAVAQSTKALVEIATQEKPNRTMIEITGDGLKKAARNLAHVIPTVLNIATQIADTVSELLAQRHR
jgi:predicted transcriptional regulator